MHEDSKRTCTVIVLFIKPFVWCRSRLLAVCFSLVIGGGYEARRFGERGMGRDMGAARARRKIDCSLFSGSRLVKN